MRRLFWFGLGASFALSVCADRAPLEPFRTTGGRLGFLVPDADTPAGLRIFIDEYQSPGGWSPWGFDRMSEGGGLFRYPRGARDWKWDREGDVVHAARSNELALVLPTVEASGTFRWSAEWFDDQWRVVRRYPADGVLTNEADALPAAPTWLDPPMPDIAELLRFAPTSLSRRLQAEYLDHAWRAVDPMPPLPTLALGGVATSAALMLEWTDARSGRSVPLQPTSAETDGARTRWRGVTPDGDVWFLAVDSSSDAALELTAWVQAAADRCFRLSLGIRFPEGEWSWFDDMQFASRVQSGQRYSFDAPSPYGLVQRRSYYPFGVIASERAVLVAETDGREPRHFQIEASGDDRALRIHYDLAATPKTRHFPGLAAVRARFRAEPRTEDHPFRVALAAWYARDPDWQTARVPAHGLWMPFTDIGSVSNAEDFHFAYFEKVGPHGVDLDNARAAGALNLIYTEPWLYWLPLANTSDWNRTAAVQRMDMLSRTAVGKDREFASAGLLGATRDANQDPRIQFLVTPWSTGARMEVNTDPELPTTSNTPVNRAMAEWRFIKNSLEDPRVDGIYLDSMSAMETIDYNPAALAVADYPATFVLADLKPGLAAPIQAVEFTAALAGYLRSRGLYLMGNFPCWKYPFFMPYIDIPGEETTWYTGKQYTPLSERERNYRRAISGAKPFGFLQATHFADLSHSDLEKYFRDCLALGFMPSFFSHDGANDPYWVDASLYERDRPLFLEYLPLTILLSESGWQPLPAVECFLPDVQVEQFGAVQSNVFWITLRNRSPRAVAGELRLRAQAGGRIAYDVGAARAHDLREAAASIELEPGAVAVWALIKPEALNEVAAWFRRHVRAHPQYLAGAINLATHARLLKAGIALSSLAPPAEENVLLETPKGMWSRGSWTSADGGTATYDRITFMPRLAPVVFDGPEGRVVAASDPVELTFAASNRSAASQTIVLSAFGDNLRERVEWTLESGAATQVVLRVNAAGARMRRILARWEVGGKTEREHEVFAIFAPPLDHLAARPGVRVLSDSAFSGYTTAPLNDGIVETAGLIWYDAAFASAETADPHWIRVLFPATENVSSVTAHWNADGGALHASRMGEVWGLLPDGRSIKLGAFDRASTGAATRIEFPPVDVRGIEWRQPPSGGSTARPNLLWLVELEVR